MARLVALLLLVSTLACAAHVGGTLEQCDEEWGTPDQKNENGELFTRGGYTITAWVNNGRVYMVTYKKFFGAFSEADVNGFLKENADSFTWVHNPNNPTVYNVTSDQNISGDRAASWDSAQGGFVKIRMLTGMPLSDSRATADTSTPATNSGTASTDSAVAAPSADVVALVKQGQQLEENNHFQEARDVLNKALTLDPTNRDGLEARARSEDDLADYPAALADFTKLIEVEPKNWWNYYYRADCESGAGNFGAAAEDCEKAYQMVGSDASNQEMILVTYGFDQYFQGNSFGATKDLDSAITLNPKDGAAFFFRGLAKKAAGTLDDAANDLAQAAALGDDIAPYVWWDTMVEAHHKDQADAGLLDLVQKAKTQTTDGRRLEEANFLLGKVSVQQLQDNAAKAGNQFLTSYFVGLALAQTGDRAGAKKAFEEFHSHCRAGTPLRLEAERHLKELTPTR